LIAGPQVRLRPLQRNRPAALALMTLISAPSALAAVATTRPTASVSSLCMTAFPPRCWRGATSLLHRLQRDQGIHHV